MGVGQVRQASIWLKPGIPRSRVIVSCSLVESRYVACSLAGALSGDECRCDLKPYLFFGL